MVSTTLVCDITRIIIGGIIISTAAAIAEPARAIPPAVIDDKTYGSVLSISLKTVPDGIADQRLWKDKSIRVIHAGFVIGITILK